MTAIEHPRFVMALWYAWGQQDAGVGHEVDAQAFAYHHARNAIWFEQSTGVHLPSVQSAWKTYIVEAQEARL